MNLIAGWIYADHSGLGRKRKRDRLMIMQEGRCAICRVDDYPERRLQADHDHETGLLRGMLCPPCYQAALEGLRARRGWKYRMARETLGRGFDPAAFDKDEVNQQLAGLAPAAP